MKSIALANNEEVFDFVKRENAPTCLLAADPAAAKREHIIGAVPLLWSIYLFQYQNY